MGGSHLSTLRSSRPDMSSWHRRCKKLLSEARFIGEVHPVERLRRVARPVRAFGRELARRPGIRVAGIVVPETPRPRPRRRVCAWNRANLRAQGAERGADSGAMHCWHERRVYWHGLLQRAFNRGNGRDCVSHPLAASGAMDRLQAWAGQQRAHGRFTPQDSETQIL